MPTKRALAILVVLLIAGCAGAPATPPLTPPTPTPAPPTLAPAILRPAGSVAGADLGYVEHLPAGYGDGTARPLLVFVHGGGEHGDGSVETLPRIFKLGVPALIEQGAWPAERPFVVLMPQYSEADANACALADELREFLAFAIDHYDVDPARVYLTGVSCGAIGSWDYLASAGGVTIAASVLIAGHLQDAWPVAGCELGRTPLWVFHGARDEIVRISNVEAAIDRLEACTSPAPVDLQLTVYPDADHDSWTRTYDLSAGNDVYAWLLRHQAD